MTQSFKDYFSGASEDYATFRPDYPVELVTYLASLSKSHGCAWDCATGTGQTAKNLATLYRTVIATDASETQLIEAQQLSDRKNIIFQKSRAEKSAIASGSADLITVSQALHWFDLDDFSIEVERVLKPGGILAVWAYDLMTVTPEIDEVVEYLYHTVLDGYWPSERKMIEDGYHDVSFPYKEIDVPTFQMEQRWDLAQLIGYLKTWSSIRRQLKTTDGELVQAELSKITKLWGAAENKRTITWPLVLRVWSK